MKMRPHCFLRPVLRPVAVFALAFGVTSLMLSAQDDDAALDADEVVTETSAEADDNASEELAIDDVAADDADGELLEVPDGTRLDVHVDAITEEMYVERSGRRWACVPVAGREGPGPSAVRDRRDLQDLLSDMQGDGAARER